MANWSAFDHTRSTGVTCPAIREWCQLYYFVDGVKFAYSLFPAIDLFTARKMSEFENELSGKR
jgi:hypothetical protein